MFSVADDATLFACDNGLNSFIKSLKHDRLLTAEWLENFNMKLNQDTYNLSMYEYKHENFSAQIAE